MAKPKTSAATTSVPSATPSAPPLPDPAFDMQFLSFLDGRRKSGDFIDPLSDDGLRLQALYVQNFSQHPMDVLRRIMENPFADPKDRIASAKTLMEYSQRKPTQQLQVKAEGIGLKVDASALSSLSSGELDTLEKLLSKAQG